MTKTRVMSAVLLFSTALFAQKTARQASEELRKITKTGASEVTKNKAAQVVQGAFNDFYFVSGGEEAVVVSMMDHYKTVYGESPFLEMRTPETDRAQQQVEEMTQKIKALLDKSKVVLDGFKASGELDAWNAVAKERQSAIDKLQKLQKKYQTALRKLLDKKYNDPAKQELQKIYREVQELEKQIDALQQQLILCRQQNKEETESEPEQYGTTPWLD